MTKFYNFLSICILFATFATSCNESEEVEASTRDADIAQLRAEGKFVVDALDPETVLSSPFEAPIIALNCFAYGFPAEGAELEIEYIAPAGLYGACYHSGEVMENLFETYKDQEWSAYSFTLHTYEDDHHFLPANKKEVLTPMTAHNENYWVFNPVFYKKEGYTVDATDPHKIKIAVTPNPGKYARCLHLYIGWEYWTNQSREGGTAIALGTNYAFPIFHQKDRNHYMDNLFIFQEGIEGPTAETLWEVLHTQDFCPDHLGRF